MILNDSAKSRAQLLAELQALRARLTLPPQGDTLGDIDDQPVQRGVSPGTRDAPDPGAARETLTASGNRNRASEYVRSLDGGLREILVIVNSTRSLDDILHQLIALASRLLRADAGAIYRLQEPEGILRVRAAHGLAAEAAVVKVPTGWGPIGLAVSQRLPVTSRLDNDRVLDASRSGVGSEQPAGWAALVRHYAAVLAVPLIIRDEVYGAIALYQHAARTFSDEEIQLALAFGDHAALGIENARLFAVAHDTAALEERQRLARELHDSVTQTLYVVKLYAEAAARRVAAGDAATASAHLREVRRAAQEALQEMRLLIFELRPPILEQEGLASAIQARLEAVEGRAGLERAFTVEGDRRPAVTVEQGLYRVAQEALNNALKHAHARRISVLLRQEPQCTLLTVADDGTGFDPEAAAAQRGLGIRGMAERVAQLGGRLTVESTPGAGTVIRVEVGS